ncbi:MAG: bifunctional adenosylcobinamide kinase/adenosylcobinamide-phosphate guanylyltransferase [Pseudomonadota bacterium]
MKHLILGGARSGKSRHAEQLAAQAGRDVVYVATAEALDEEMAARIAHHRVQRPAGWSLVEEPLALARVLHREAAADRCLLVDCLTLWLGNLLAQGDERMAQEMDELYAVLPELPGDVLLVSNEVGWGIVPDNPLARRFRDEAGRLHQRLAQLCDRVTLVAAGLPLSLK